MTIETLNLIFKWTAAVLPFVLAVVGVGALITGNIIAARKDAEIQTLKPRHLSMQQVQAFASSGKGDGTASYNIQVAPDKRSIESGIYANEIEDMLRDNGWVLANAISYQEFLVGDKPGIILVYNSQKPPQAAAVLERGLRAANIEFTQENPRFIGVSQPLFIAVNPR
jgi:hypothetical protein